MKCLSWICLNNSRIDNIVPIKAWTKGRATAPHSFPKFSLLLAYA